MRRQQGGVGSGMWRGGGCSKERTTEEVTWREDLERWSTDQWLRLPVMPQELRICPLGSPQDSASLATPSCCCCWHTDGKVAGLEIIVFASEGEGWLQGEARRLLPCMKDQVQTKKPKAGK